MSYYDYAFEGAVEKLAIGNGRKVLYYNVILLPEELIKALPFKKFPKLRIIGEVADHPIRGAWNPVADGRKYFILSQRFLDNADLGIGDMVEMRFNIDDQDYVDIPIELESELSTNGALAEKWQALTSGKKRFYCYQIDSAKQQATRQNRLQKVMTELLG